MRITVLLPGTLREKAGGEAKLAVEVAELTAMLRNMRRSSIGSARRGS